MHIFHVVWTCPKIRPFWDAIRKVINATSDLALSLDSKVFLLGVLDGAELSHYLCICFLRLFLCL